MSAAAERAYRVALVGAQGTGKTSLIKRHKTGKFDPDEPPTRQTEHTLLRFNTTLGVIELAVDEILGNQFGPYDGTIILYDASDPDPHEAICHHLAGAARACVACGNKYDLVPEDHPAQCVPGVDNYRISARSLYNFEKPFLSILRQIAGVDLDFVDTPV